MKCCESIVTDLLAREGKSLEELKASAKQWWKEQAQHDREQLQKDHEALLQSQKLPETPQAKSESTPIKPAPERHDASPVKPLSSILNVPKLFASPHTTKQVADLWVAYHTMQSEGTGKGFISASMPTETYTKMTSLAQKYSSLVVPLPRPKDSSEPEDNGDPYEFFFMQWDFHHRPPHPTAMQELFVSPASAASSNPPISTIIFTPLQEYKLRGTYATPFLVLTNYTDLASTHDVVLLRGEITPSSSGSSFLLKQEDAQYLAMALQKFFLWDEKDGEGKRLLQTFHERPEEFRWEELIQHSRL
ncbi:ATP11 protein-domain-containing protein [Flagelloscypha sp. PMI_526]|nr:ATP11 protein-domain-containing protein [Flagelloscypha sp. PMI_526]